MATITAYLIAAFLAVVSAIISKIIPLKPMATHHRMYKQSLTNRQFQNPFDLVAVEYL